MISNRAIAAPPVDCAHLGLAMIGIHQVLPMLILPWSAKTVSGRTDAVYCTEETRQNAIMIPIRLHRGTFVRGVRPTRYECVNFFFVGLILTYKYVRIRNAFT